MGVSHVCHPAALHNRTQRPARPTSYAGRCGPRGQQATGADDGRMQGGGGRWLAGERGSGCWRAMALPSPQLDLFPAPPPRAPPHKGGAPGVGLSLPNGHSGGRDGGSEGCVAWRKVGVVAGVRRRRVRLTARCVVCNAHSFIGRGVGGHNNPGSTAQHRGAARASPGMMPGEPVVSSPAGGSADGTAAAAPAAAAAAAAAPGPDLARA